MVFLAVVAGGGAYVPVDPDQPAERIGHILDTADPVCVLTTTRDGFDAVGRATVRIDGPDLSGYSAAPVTDADRVGVLRPTHPAYVIFTSGSTGKPKGVAVPHSAIVNQMEWMQSEYRLDGSDVYLQKTATTFDLSVWAFFMPLRVGAQLVLATPDGHRDPGYVADTIAEHGVTVIDFVPSMLAVFTASVDPVKLVSLRQVFVIGEALPLETVRAFARVSSAAVHNLYGPTEAAVSITYRDVTGGDAGAVSIGWPQWNSQVYVLDSRLRPVPAGVPGELYLAGDQLARGYYGRVDLTSDRFVANPFSSTGERMYRTGDLVAWGKDGELGYIGRTDFQVKFRGQRIELREIETAVLAHESVLQSAVLVVPTATGDQLVAYVVPASGASAGADELKAFAARSLPGYMVPAAVVVLAEFPLNPSGKLDRKALPAPVFGARVFRAPVTAAEQIVAGVFAEVLGVDRVGLDDDFFELGGNSLVATQVTARLGVALNATVPLRALFDAPTVVALAVRVEQHNGKGDRVPLEALDRPEQIPLSLAQQRMWFINRFDPESAAYNIPVAIRLSGDLDIAALQAAMADVLERHESLRTVYPEVDGVAQQVILPAAQVVPDLTPVAIRESEVFERVVALVSAPFDVTASAPLRATLFEVGSAEYVLVLTVHHISADGWSITPLTRDVVLAYAARTTGQAPAWSPLAVQYADFALWQRRLLGAEDDPASLLATQLDYWRGALAGAPDLLELPTDRPRPAVASNRGASLAFEISPELHAGVGRIGREHGVTQFMVVHAALAVLLARLSGSSDIAVGAPMAGRGEAVLDDLVGMFVNTLVLRTEVDVAESFAGLMARVRDTDLSAFEYSDVPFERLVNAIAPTRSQSHSPLFQVSLTFQNMARTDLELPGLTISALDQGIQVTQFDLDLTLNEAFTDEGDPNGMHASFTYATDLFDEATVAGFADRFVRILAAAVADPRSPIGDVEILAGDEQERVLREWNQTAVELAPATLVELFDAQVGRTPDAVALRFEGAQLTYREFDERANRLARKLIADGVGPEMLVGLAMRRSLELMIGMYAVVKAGGAYVPIDPDHPADRIEYVLESSAPVCVLTTAADEVVLPEHVTVVEIDGLDLSAVDGAPIVDAERHAPLRPQNTAYVIYTSGSTGRPKGVAVSHTAITNQTRWMHSYFRMSGRDRAMQKAPITFDVSVWECFAVHQVGGRLVVLRPDGHRDPAYMAEVMHAEGITIAEFVPSLLDVFLADPNLGMPESMRQILGGGEALSPQTARKVAKLGVKVENTYGPTEAAITTTYFDCTVTDESSVVPIGRAVWNTRSYVLDARLNPVPVGVAGELYQSGDQLARGYVGRADLTADRFVADPFGEPGARMYRTGDLVRWNADGQLEFLGRTDFQVKLRGLRIELGEVESALLRSEAVVQAIVTVVRGPHGGEHLVGYVTVQPGAATTGQDLRLAVAADLPAYMVPSQILVLDQFPVSAAGKIDRRALPDPVFEAREFRAPVTKVEQTVAGVFGEVLGVERVGLDDDFFDLGGNSLVATRVSSLLGAELAMQIPVLWLFTSSSVEALAARVASARLGLENLS
ncbi:amino acid adenylation domain-containing protein, partial [Rhodococcus sp. NPDC058514]|uniref:amino acid adenylation domain-containing protein n=1 Tax=Rhodococcus sp. NPDC058514 TaxID=3346532 RepID=UPI0036666EB7